MGKRGNAGEGREGRKRKEVKWSKREERRGKNGGEWRENEGEVKSDVKENDVEGKTWKCGEEKYKEEKANERKEEKA